VGAHNASGWSAVGFVEFLRARKDADVRHERPFWKVRLPWIESIQWSDRIRSVLEGTLPPTWDGIRKPFRA